MGCNIKNKVKSQTKIARFREKGTVRFTERQKSPEQRGLRN
jgi:hypothetical protein